MSKHQIRKKILKTWLIQNTNVNSITVDCLLKGGGYILIIALILYKKLKIYYSLVCICRLHACILDLCSIINLANSIFISWYILWVFIVISPTLPSCQTINSDIWSLCPHLQPSLNNFSRWWKQNLWELFRRPYYLISDRKRFWIGSYTEANYAVQKQDDIILMLASKRDPQKTLCDRWISSRPSKSKFHLFLHICIEEHV